MAEKKMRCMQVFLISKQPPCHNIQIPWKKVTLAGVRLVITVAVAFIRASVKQGEFSRSPFRINLYRIP